MLAVLVAALFVTFFFLNHKENQYLSNNLKEITLVNSENKQVKIYAEVVDNESARDQGLSGREKLPENQGMLFVFDSDQVLSFWMKDMKFSLDMIFLDSNYKIIDINENAQPCPSIKNCPIYIAKNPGKYVLEIDAGLAKKNNLKIGDVAVV